MSPIAAAARIAPNTPGVYFLLDGDTELLYVGKAGNLRQRLRQHANARPGPRETRRLTLYRRVAEVRWEEQPDEPAAAVREADLIAALRPAFNAGSTLAARWHYLTVQPIDSRRRRFTLTREASTASEARCYGCFPHLGSGLASPPGIACSDGYPALLRLLWAASDEPGNRVPSRLTRTAPQAATVPVSPALLVPLHAFLSGTSRRLLDAVAAAGGYRDEYLQPGLARDRDAAGQFFRYGPAALRAMRLRHRRRPGPVSRTAIEEWVTAEVRAAIGKFRLSATESALGGAGVDLAYG